MSKYIYSYNITYKIEDGFLIINSKTQDWDNTYKYKLENIYMMKTIIHSNEYNEYDKHTEKFFRNIRLLIFLEIITKNEPKLYDHIQAQYKGEFTKIKAVFSEFTSTEENHDFIEKEHQKIKNIANNINNLLGAYDND